MIAWLILKTFTACYKDSRSKTYSPYFSANSFTGGTFFPYLLKAPRVLGRVLSVFFLPKLMLGDFLFSKGRRWLIISWSIFTRVLMHYQRPKSRTKARERAEFLRSWDHAVLQATCCLHGESHPDCCRLPYKEKSVHPTPCFAEHPCDLSAQHLQTLCEWKEHTNDFLDLELATFSYQCSGPTRWSPW